MAWRERLGMGTIYHDGIEFELAEEDGDLIETAMADRDEFLEAHGDELEADDISLDAPDSELLAWAERNLVGDAQAKIDWPLWSEMDRNGVSVSDFIDGGR